MLVIVLYFYCLIHSWEELLRFLVISWPRSGSQNHKVAEVGSDLCRSSSPSPLLSRCWLMINVVSTRPPGPFLESCFPAGSLQCWLVLGVLHTQEQDLALLLVVLREVPGVAHFSSLSRSLSMQQDPRGNQPLLRVWCYHQIREGPLCPIILMMSKGVPPQTRDVLLMGAVSHAESESACGLVGWRGKALRRSHSGTCRASVQVVPVGAGGPCPGSPFGESWLPGLDEPLGRRAHVPGNTLDLLVPPGGPSIKRPVQEP